MEENTHTRTLFLTSTILIAVLSFGFALISFLSSPTESALLEQQDAGAAQQDSSGFGDPPNENGARGGATPLETIALFKAALEAEDIARAGTYFVPDERRARTDELYDIQQGGLLPELVSRLAKADTQYPLIEGDTDAFIFESFNERGELTLQLYLVELPNGTWNIADM